MKNFSNYINYEYLDYILESLKDFKRFKEFILYKITRITVQRIILLYLKNNLFTELYIIYKINYISFHIKIFMCS